MKNLGVTMNKQGIERYTITKNSVAYHTESNNKKNFFENKNKTIIKKCRCDSFMNLYAMQHYGGRK